MHNYDTVTEAISDLRNRGFVEDFNLADNCIVCQSEKLSPDEFEISEVYRFEGDSDPGDEAVVYGIESVVGHKGVLVNGYGYQSDPMSDELARKLKLHTI